ncbi:glycosyltransferase, partial [Methylobacterium trifolii]
MPPAIVCVPARDEAERLPRLLRSLDGQAGFSPEERLRVVVVANNCSDGTADIVRALEASGAIPNLDLRLIEVQVAGAAAHVGTARRMALEAGADWFAADGIRDGILLTTDADVRPPAGWVAANLRALAEADVVGGRLVIDAEDEAA